MNNRDKVKSALNVAILAGTNIELKASELQALLDDYDHMLVALKKVEQWFDQTPDANKSFPIEVIGIALASVESE